MFPTLKKPIKEIMEIYENGRICIQHFSDIIRTLILEHIGGIWIDATVFVSPDWDRDLIGKAFYTGCRTEAYANSGRSITNGQWTSYFIASVKGNPLMSLIHEGLLVCYRCEGKIEEYYTMDYIFAIGMRESKEIRRIIATVPKINANLFGLEDLMCKSYKKEEYDAFILTAPFFKLNHRMEYSYHDDEGNNTVYYHVSHMLN